MMDINKIEPIKSIEEYLEFYSKSSTKDLYSHSKILQNFIYNYPDNRIGSLFYGFKLNSFENKTLSELIYLSLYAKKPVSILAAVPTLEQRHSFDLAFLSFKKRCRNLFDFKFVHTVDKYWIKLNPVILNSILLQWKIENQIYPIYFN